MRKLILLLVVALSAATIQAQSLDLGVKIGANFANLNDASGLKFKNKTGLVAGAFVTVGMSNFAIQPEILYSQEGAKTDLGDFDLDYINVPVMFKYYLVGNVLNIQAGPQFGFLTSHSLKDQIDAKDFDFSGAAGAGLDLPFGLRVDARYHFGFTKVTNEHDGKSGVFSLALGYSFL